MTITPDIDTAIPAWLNLDGVIPPEILDQIPGLEAQARQLAVAVAEYIMHTDEVRTGYMRALEGSLDDVRLFDDWGPWSELIGRLTGFDRVEMVEQSAAAALQTFLDDIHFADKAMVYAERMELPMLAAYLRDEVARDEERLAHRAEMNVIAAERKASREAAELEEQQP